MFSTTHTLTMPHSHRRNRINLVCHRCGRVEKTRDHLRSHLSDTHNIYEADDPNIRTAKVAHLKRKNMPGLEEILLAETPLLDQYRKRYFDLEFQRQQLEPGVEWVYPVERPTAVLNDYMSGRIKTPRKAQLVQAVSDLRQTNEFWADKISKLEGHIESLVSATQPSPGGSQGFQAPFVAAPSTIVAHGSHYGRDQGPDDIIDPTLLAQQRISDASRGEAQGYQAPFVAAASSMVNNWGQYGQAPVPEANAAPEYEWQQREELEQEEQSWEPQWGVPEQEEQSWGPQWGVPEQEEQPWGQQQEGKYRYPPPPFPQPPSP